MSNYRFAAAALLFCWTQSSFAADWPAYQHDVRRTGYSEEKIDVRRLQLKWTWRSPSPPQPAWAGPAKWDAYAGHRDLPSMRNYDLSFQPISVGGSVFFGSSADDTLYCLEAASGQEKWAFVTDGPIRTAPSFANGRLFFGSDDGFAYCLDADDGSLIWRFRPVETKRWIVNDGRFIPLHPCRTGVLVDAGRAYFGCALLPWKDAYLCGVNVETGAAEGKGCFVKKLNGATLEGPPAATSALLVFPQGRVAPRVFNRIDGKEQGQLKKSSGGSLVVVSLDANVFHGPGADSRKGGINSTNLKTREAIATHGRGNALVVAGHVSYMLTDDAIIASDLVKRENRWTAPCDQPYSLIGVGDVLFAGGRDEVVAYKAQDGQPIWRHQVEGKAHRLAAANGRLLVSTDMGIIQSFEAACAGGQPVAKSSETDDGFQPAQVAEIADETAKHAATKADLLPDKPKQKAVYELAAGPWLQFTDPQSAVVRWRTKESVPTLLEYRLDGKVTRVADEAASKEHRVELAGLQRNRVYRYVIQRPRDGQLVATSEFECDTFFNFTLPPVGGSGSDEFADAAKSILEQANVDRGICFVLGSEKAALALELARRSQLRVVAVETDKRNVRVSRDVLKAAGVYGRRVTVRKVDDFAKLPFVGHSANLVVSELPLSELTGCAAEVFRMLRPDGGVACIGFGATRSSRQEQRRWWKQAGIEVPLIEDKASGYTLVRRSSLPGAGEWSHLYGLADNSAFGGEQLAGVESADDLEVQWVGRPGPRFKPDRNGRKPAPLSTAGRLFIQGLHRMAALDAYNGTVLWSLEIPELQRFNMPRDCGNWCADRDFVYAAIRDKCWQIAAASGEVVKIHDVITVKGRSDEFDWGALVSRDNQLLGAAVKQGTSWTNFWGNADAGWYDARSGAVTDKICADNLFSIDKKTGETKWTYAKGVVINSTLTVHDNVVYFVESRNAEVVGSPERRIGNPKLWEDQFLVALEAYTGTVIWERPIDTEDGKVVFYMAGGSDGRLVIVASADQNYHVYGFATDQGEQLWHQTFGWPGGKGDHGKAMSRPAIVGDRVYVRPHAFQLADGKRLRQQMPGGGCGTYACSSTALFFRASRVTMWNQANGTSTGWNRLRPDCWLSAIPAAGMLLSAEGGGGCSCGTWMETSVGFMPVSHR